jgi:hypothetical protein
MKVSELIEKLREVPQDAEVKFKEVQVSLVYGVQSYGETRISTITEDKERNIVYLWEN